MPDHTTIPSKRCARCECHFPATTEYFGVDKRMSLGLTSYCKPCNRAWHKEFYAANADRLAAEKRAKYAANPQQMLSINHKSYTKHRRKRLDEKKVYARAKHEQMVVHWRNMYAKRKKHAEGTHTAEDIQVQYASQSGRCYWCNKKVGKKYHVDHIIPLSRGGSNWPDNLCVACPECNMKKHDKTPQEMGRLF